MSEKEEETNANDQDLPNQNRKKVRQVFSK